MRSSNIRSNEITKLEKRPIALERRLDPAKALARPLPSPQKKARPASKGRVRKGKSRS
jgi:hypothetical protein